MTYMEMNVTYIELNLTYLVMCLYDDFDTLQTLFTLEICFI